MQWLCRLNLFSGEKNWKISDLSTQCQCNLFNSSHKWARMELNEIPWCTSFEKKVSFRSPVKSWDNSSLLFWNEIMCVSHWTEAWWWRFKEGGAFFGCPLSKPLQHKSYCHTTLSEDAVACFVIKKKHLDSDPSSFFLLLKVLSL